MKLTLLALLLSLPRPARAQAQPQPAAAGSLQDVVIKTSEKDEPSAEKPAFEVPVDPYESLRPTLKPDEALLLAESPALATWDRSRPDSLREALIEPWNDSLVELSQMELAPAKVLAGDRPSVKARVEAWTLSLVDEDGKPFKNFEGKGEPPASLAWDGRSDQGGWMLAGHAYSAVYKVAQSSASSRTVMGRQFQFPGLVYREAQDSVVGLDSSALFGADRGQKEIAGPGKTLLRAAADWIKRREYGRPLRVKAYAANPELAKAQATAARGWLAAELSLPETRIAAEGAAAASSEQRLELLVDDR